MAARSSVSSSITPFPQFSNEHFEACMSDVSNEELQNSAAEPTVLSDVVLAALSAATKYTAASQADRSKSMDPRISTSPELPSQVRSGTRAPHNTLEKRSVCFSQGEVENGISTRDEPKYAPIQRNSSKGPGNGTESESDDSGGVNHVKDQRQLQIADSKTRWPKKSTRAKNKVRNFWKSISNRRW